MYERPRHERAHCGCCTVMSAFGTAGQRQRFKAVSADTGMGHDPQPQPFVADVCRMIGRLPITNAAISRIH